MILEITVKMKDGKTYKFNSQAEAIRKAREEAGLTQAQAAEALGIKVQNWQAYEYGTREPKEDMLEKIARVLNISVDKLYRFTLD
jgi:DNA-binding helix-turn-helix protein|nr:MAG TPA: Helix-turn-helix XRE-family like protein [Caudoviricetes sp.]